MSKRKAELIEHLTQALDILESDGQQLETPLAVFGKYCPTGVKLRTGGDARRGGAHYYLTMPPSWPKPDGYWLFGENSSGWWTTSWAPTEKDAYLLGLTKLISVLMSPPVIVDAEES